MTVWGCAGVAAGGVAGGVAAAAAAAWGTGVVGVSADMDSSCQWSVVSAVVSGSVNDCPVRWQRQSHYGPLIHGFWS